jgi:hypothetical protein
LHTEASQTALPLNGTGQAIPHAPQCNGELLVSAQAPPQSIFPPVHVLVQAPSEHTCPVGHALPHFPQFCGSLAMSTQSEPQLLNPGAHTAWHVPSTQAAEALPGATQRTPHPPQFCGSLARSRQAPSQEESGASH